MKSITIAFLFIVIPYLGLAQNCISHGPVRSALIYDCDRPHDTSAHLIEQLFFNEQKQVVLSISFSDTLGNNKYTLYMVDSNDKMYNRFIESKTYGKNGALLQTNKTILDSNGTFIPYREIQLLDFCEWKNPGVKCIYDRYGNVETAILYREGTTNIQIAKYKVKYLYR